MNIIKQQFRFIVEGKPFVITVDYEHPNLVHTYKYRPLHLYKTEFATIHNRIETSEFVEDIQFLFNQFEKDSAPKDNLVVYALSEICTKHIKKYGRLIISDLQTFLDEMLIIFEHIEAAKGIPLSLNDGYDIWEHYFEAMKHIFQNYIWITSPFDPNQLTKLT